MESPDREVRLFSVRLLWERHRPTHLPATWKPKGKNASQVPETVRFEDLEKRCEIFSDGCSSGCLRVAWSGATTTARGGTFPRARRSAT